MSLVGFKARNHSQQVNRRGASDKVDDRGTPWDLFNELSERFGGFTLDVAAAPHNTKCERFYSIEDDGLSRSWAGERVWCNPPYSDLDGWVRKAWIEHPSTPLIVMLVPANRCEQRWWQDWIEPHHRARTDMFSIEFLRGRTRFHANGDDPIVPNMRPPFGCALLIWDRRHRCAHPDCDRNGDHLSGTDDRPWCAEHCPECQEGMT